MAERDALSVSEEEQIPVTLFSWAVANGVNHMTVEQIRSLSEVVADMMNHCGMSGYAEAERRYKKEE